MANGRRYVRPTERTVALALAIAFSSGCVANNYSITHGELVRLANTPPTERWRAVRATQALTGGSVPPDDAHMLPRRSLDGLPDVRIVTDFEPVQLPRLPSVVVPPGPPGTFGLPGHIGVGGSLGSIGGGGGSSGGSSSGGGNWGDAGIALAIVAVAGISIVGVVFAVTEAVRYDGWIAVSPDEPIYLRMHGETVGVPLSALTPDLAAQAGGARIYEESAGRFVPLARGPLNRTGFGLAFGAIGTGISMPDGSRALGGGARGTVSWSFWNFVTIAAALDVSAGTSHGVNGTLATFGPELSVFPVRWLGAYGGVGYADRQISNGSLGWSNEGVFARVGLVGEIPIETRLAIQIRTGAIRTAVGDPFATWNLEASACLAVY